MACIALNNVYPNLDLTYVQPTRRYSIERDPFLLLIEEVIDYSLRHHNIHHWNPPLNLDAARLMNRFTYFNETFAAFVVSRDTEEQALLLANNLGFDEARWLEFSDREEARSYQEYYLLNIYDEHKPFLFQMFSFACYASRIALQRRLHTLVKDVVWALLATLRQILPKEEYYREFYFVEDVYGDEPIDSQLIDVDEGIEDEDNSLRENLISFPLVHADPILLFVEELIDYSLRSNNLQGWIPPIDLGVLRRTQMRYFTENIRTATFHHCTEDYALNAARILGFNEERWLQLYTRSEARNLQNYFLWQILHFVEGRNELFVFSFACYSSQLAMRKNRNSLVNEVVFALVHLLRQYSPDQQHYREIDDIACRYIGLLFDAHSLSEDGGIENEDIALEENFDCEVGFADNEASN